MAGHSKWSNIKHRKQAQDKKRGKKFAKIIRAIEAAAREADTSDPEEDPTLETYVQKAKDADVPKDTWQRAAKRGAGELDGGRSYEPAQYEGYAAGGVAVLVDCLTDNRNRTASDVRNIFQEVEGNLAEPGAVSFLFSRRGQVKVAADGTGEDDVMVAGIEAGLEDLDVDDELITAWCAPGDHQQLREALEDAGLPVEESGTTMVPSTTVPVTEPGEARRVLRLMDLLDDNDDVQEVYANFDIPEGLLEEVEAAV